MSPSEFYDLSFTEWKDAVDGLNESLRGGPAAEPATSDIFERMSEHVGPTPSVRH